MDSIPRCGPPLWRSLNSPMDMGEEGGDGGACSLGTLNPQMPSRQSLKALAETARAFAFRARIPPRPAHRSRTGGASVLPRQMFQYEVVGGSSNTNPQEAELGQSTE